ncbi:SDR family NAD(P)-dependent oxidoreductase [Salinicoccus halodurans]|uniref:Diacetyl reductase [(S)-acetoin forming] n=1 Tax=Salinicoccus halodurans TaxID=407035 RepID=A0A0F7HLJ6_9STAP|nr:glucose 1-dehydrogenase [Salinicoccus halodurans]AKG73973.1 hypothetical protein AAT16_06860 [Salinicoccus halodurans]SFK58696.1 3-oxoacyl-[acyl-carrier protein] reductase [Salinicoccus halodurans]
MGRLENKMALIIGGTSGIGEAVARAFADEGAKVAVAGRKETDGKRIVDEIEENDGKAIFIRIDTTKAEDLKKGFSKMIEEFGTIDILYNGAGIHDSYQNAVETDEEMYDKLMEVNVKGPFLAAREVLPVMLEKGKGTIINIGSQSTFVAGAGGSSYVTSKHAIEGFTKQLTYDFGSKGIKANLIAPGFITTPMVEGVNEERLKDIPAQRAGKPEEVASIAVFLASEESDYVQGASIKMDGGWTVGR